MDPNVKRLMAVLAMSSLLVVSLAGVTTAGDGDGYGKKIKACTGLSYGQLKNVARAGELARKTRQHIKPLCDPDVNVPGIGKNLSYGKRIKECTDLSYGQLKRAAKRGGIERHDPAIIEGFKPAWGAKKTWM